MYTIAFSKLNYPQSPPNAAMLNLSNKIADATMSNGAILLDRSKKAYEDGLLTVVTGADTCK